MRNFTWLKQGVLMLGALTVALVAFGHEPLLVQAEFFKNLDTLCKNGFHCPEAETAGGAVAEIAEGLAKNVRAIVGAVAIAIIMIAGVKLVMNDGNEETLDKQTTTIVYTVIGLFMIGMAGEISQIFTVDNGGFLKDANVSLQKSRLFTRTVEVVITFIKYIIASFAVFGIVSSGLRLILVGSNDDELEKDKKRIGWSLGGLAIVLLANPFINKIFFKVDTDKFPGLETVRPAIDRVALIKEIAGVTNIFASFAGPLALLSLVAGGVLYSFGAGDEERLGRAKKIITWSIIGLVIIYGAFAIVTLFVTREFTGI